MLRSICLSVPIIALAMAPAFAGSALPVTEIEPEITKPKHVESVESHRQLCRGKENRRSDRDGNGCGVALVGGIVLLGLLGAVGGSSDNTQ